MRTESILRLLASAEEAKTPDELLRGFEATLALYDFDSYLLFRHAGAVSPESDVMAGKSFSGERPSPSVMPDVVLWRLRTGANGFRIRDAVENAAPLRKRRSRKKVIVPPSGWKDGYAFPIHNGRGFAGSVALLGDRDLSSLEVRLFETASRAIFWRYLEHTDEPVGPADLTLTRRETEVLTFLADGMTSNEIGKSLNISAHTVDWYMNGLQEKFAARNRPHLLAVVFRLGLIG